MKQPEGLVMPRKEHNIFKLIKSLCGLKHEPKQSHQNFDDIVLTNGFKLNQSKKYIYIKFYVPSKRVII